MRRACWTPTLWRCGATTTLMSPRTRWAPFACVSLCVLGARQLDEWTCYEQVEAIKDVSAWLDELKEQSPEQPEDEE